VSEGLAFSVVIPSRGGQSLESLLDALDAQTMARDRFEIIVAFDGVEPTQAQQRALESRGVQCVQLEPRRGPGAARNAGARMARAEWLAFTEDDVTPAPDWLERAWARLNAAPIPDVLVGLTLLPGGRPLRIQLEEGPQYLPTNLFVRRSWFERVGGYCEAFFDPSGAIYFREDADLGFGLEEAGAVVVADDAVAVTHPDEHPGYFDPLRWARRYKMDPLLAARHPELFRERIEVHRLGPFKVSRPIVRSCYGIVMCELGALVALALGAASRAMLLAIVAAVLHLPLVFKWRSRLWRLPVIPLVPWVMVAALVQGRMQATRGVADSR